MMMVTFNCSLNSCTHMLAQSAHMLMMKTDFLVGLFPVGIDIPDYIASVGKSDAIKSMCDKMKALGRKK